MATSKHDTYPVLAFKTAVLFEKWLAGHHAKAAGVWLKIAKAASGVKTVSNPEALDIALCYGWIDGLRRALDETYFLQKYTPRTATSIWSVINKKKVAALIKEGRMQPAGFAAVDAAKKDGRWARAYDSSKNITVPVDLQKALDTNKNAASFFAGLSSQNRFAILFRIHQMKKPETRAQKIEHFVQMLERNETIYPQKK